MERRVLREILCVKQRHTCIGSVHVDDSSNRSWRQQWLALVPKRTLAVFMNQVCNSLLKRRDQNYTGIDRQRQRVHFGMLESPRTSSGASCPSAFSILPPRLSVGGSIDSDSSSSAPQSSWEPASFFCHYISKMTLFSNPAKADKYHQPVTSYISNSNTAASKSFYISISFAGSGR